MSDWDVLDKVEFIQKNHFAPGWPFWLNAILFPCLGALFYLALYYPRTWYAKVNVWYENRHKLAIAALNEKTNPKAILFELELRREIMKVWLPNKDNGIMNLLKRIWENPNLKISIERTDTGAHIYYDQAIVWGKSDKEASDVIRRFYE